MPRVLYIMYNGLVHPSGEQSLNMNRLRSLEALGTECVAGALEGPGTLADAAKLSEAERMVAAAAPTARVHFIRRRAVLVGGAARFLADACRETPPGIVVFTQPQAVRLVAELCRRFTVPALWDARAGRQARILRRRRGLGAVKDWLYAQSYALAARASSHAVCVSQNLAREFADAYQFQESQLTVIPNAADTSLFRPLPSARGEVRRKLGWEERLIFVYSGVVFQGFSEAVQLFDTVRHVEPRARFLGVVTDLDAARRRIPDWPRDIWTLVSTPYNEVHRYLAAADVGINVHWPSPGKAVASPVKFAEYLACGLPVLNADKVGDYPDLVRRHRLGVVIDMHRAETWRAAVQQLITLLEAEGDEIRERCRSIAERDLSWERQTELLGSAIRATLASKLTT